MQTEFTKNLNKLWGDNDSVDHFRYFCDLAFGWYKMVMSAKEKPRIVILGTGIPDELICSFGVYPLHILGGSLEACGWSERIVPRDTDPVSRSILGYINNPDGFDSSESLFMIPLNCDSMRKMAYLLKREGKKVCTVDVSPVRSGSCSGDKWRKQMIQMLERVSGHLHRGTDEKKIVAAYKKFAAARRDMRHYMEIISSCPGVLTDNARLLVQNSYYYTKDIDEWRRALHRLAKETVSVYKSNLSAEAHKPKVLLMGSQIIFPNYKIPDLMTEVGLSVWKTVDASTMIMNIKSPGIDHPKVFDEIVDAWYKADGSGAFIENEATRKYVTRMAEFEDVDGVVFHVLKGQIDQDFELEFFERVFEENRIPVIRLETDYQYQDIEQLRIRVEAFAEMLMNRSKASFESRRRA